MSDPYLALNDDDESHFNGTDTDGRLEHANGPAATAVLIILYACIQVVGLVGNSLILVIVLRHKRMRSVTNFFLANLAGADLMVAVFCTCQQMLLNFVLEDWVFGDGWVGISLCKANGFVRNFSHCASTSLLLLLAFERFLAIVHPFTSRIYLLSRSTLKWSAIAVWAVAAVVAIPNAFFFVVMSHDYEVYVGQRLVQRHQHLCIRDYRMAPGPMGFLAYDVLCFIFFFIVPFFTMACLYCCVGMTLWKSTKSDIGVMSVVSSPRPDFPALTDSGTTVFVSPKGSYHETRLSDSGRGSWDLATPQDAVTMGDSSRNSPESQSLQPSSVSSDIAIRKGILQNRKKVIRMLVVIVTVFVVCWLPLHARKLYVFLYGLPRDRPWIGTYLIPISDWLINLNSAVNPLIYALFSENFRLAAADTLWCRMPKTAFSRTRSTTSYRFSSY